jgi:ferredoxin-like protein FixX
MIANYGYQDGSGAYYIRIDTDACLSCAARACLVACPARLFELFVDDYDDEGVRVAEAHRRTLAVDCAACKPTGAAAMAAGRAGLPCIAACLPGALEHSW